MTPIRNWDAVYILRIRRLHRLLDLRAPTVVIEREMYLVLSALAHGNWHAVWHHAWWHLSSAWRNWRWDCRIWLWRKRGLTEDEIEAKLCPTCAAKPS